jgi:hypothetical protein
MEAQDVPLPRVLTLPGAAEVNTPDLEGVGEKPLLGLIVKGVLRGERGTCNSP